MTQCEIDLCAIDLRGDGGVCRGLGVKRVFVDDLNFE